jgi:hypothetical protein
LAGLKLRIPLWKGRLDLTSNVRYFPPTRADTKEDLGVIWESTAQLSVPFTSQLRLTLTADFYFYRVKVDQLTADQSATNQPLVRGNATNINLSAGLAFDHSWKL